MNGCVIATYRCNSRCHMCDIWKFPSRKEDEITPDTIARLPEGFGRINLTGGEPMLRDDILEIVRILRTKARLVEISTNGFYTEKIVEIANTFPTRVMFRISIEGLPRLNDELRGIRDGFEHALKTVIELGKTKVKDYGFSIVICDRNAPDLIPTYELCARLGVEFGNSTMHNSWYFHKHDNKMENTELALSTEKRFIRALLESGRKNIPMRVKDWLRAYFNLNILAHLAGECTVITSCCAGEDLFFVDPYGYVMPCNGSEEEWVMGDLKKQEWNEIWNGEEAKKVRERVRGCRRECAMIQTARVDMRKHPVKSILWIVKNKIRLMRGREIDFS